MHVERDIVLTNPSIRPSVPLSVCPMPVLFVNELIYHHTFYCLTWASFYFFEPKRRHKNSMGNQLSGR